MTLFAAAPGNGAETLDWAVTIGISALCVFFGFRGNGLTAKHYFSLGYDFTHPDSADARSWGL